MIASASALAAALTRLGASGSARPGRLLTAAACLVISTLPAHTGAEQREREPASPRPPIVHRFLTRSDEPLRAYHARRRLEARNARFRKEAWLEAWTWLDPDEGFRFEVIAEGGSKYIRNRVLRRALETEQRTIESGDPARVAFSDANYTFDHVEAAGNRYVLLRVKPKREEILLIDGWLLVTNEADLVELAGVLAKGPSFWTPRVEVRRKYERRSGVRVPVLVESTAHVRIAGRSEFRMTYDYESINGLPVAVRSASHTGGRP